MFTGFSSFRSYQRLNTTQPQRNAALPPPHFLAPPPFIFHASSISFIRQFISYVKLRRLARVSVERVGVGGTRDAAAPLSQFLSPSTTSSTSSYAKLRCNKISYYRIKPASSHMLRKQPQQLTKDKTRNAENQSSPRINIQISSRRHFNRNLSTFQLPLPIFTLCLFICLFVCF